MHPGTSPLDVPAGRTRGRAATRPCLRVVVLCAVLTSLPALAARPYRGGVVASAHPLASEAALAMLNRGGNAADAAVAAAFVLAVVGPYHSGIGGGGFALTYQAKEAKAQVLDFREVAPAAAAPDMYLANGEVVPGRSTDGALSVAVPGAVAGYLELLAKRGRLKPAVVLAPAIAAAKDGFWVSPKYQALARSRLQCLRGDPEASRLFLRPNGQGVADVPVVGTVLKQPELAQTLTQLSRRGAESFYRGATAQRLAEHLAKLGGILTAEDLGRYQVRWREPLEGSYRGHRILTMPPPSAGGIAVLQVLGILESAPVEFRSVASLHRYAEAVRRAYVDRVKYLGDPAFVQIPPHLTSREYLAQLASTIDPKRATASRALLPPELAAPPKGTVHPPEGGEKKNTTHISVLDKDGNAVALTTTVNYAFGSCVVVPGTGVLLNDEMDDFAAKPGTPNVFGLVTGEANAVAPGKIPLSSMSPTLVFQKDDANRVMLVVGSPGGPTIPTTVIQVISNVVDHQMDVVRAVGHGRLHHQYLPDALAVDRYGLEASTAEGLRALGHTLARLDGWGDAEAVLEEPQTRLRYSAADPRNEGAGLGQD